LFSLLRLNSNGTKSPSGVSSTARASISFYGGLKDCVMDCWTDEIRQPSEPPLKRHLPFFKRGPDKVRQFRQGSTDGGKTWKPE